MDVEPNVIVATTRSPMLPKIEELHEEKLFHSQMWVRGRPLHFIVDSSNQKNLVHVDIVKSLNLFVKPHAKL